MAKSVGSGAAPQSSFSPVSATLLALAAFGGSRTWPMRMVEVCDADVDVR